MNPTDCVARAVGDAEVGGIAEAVGGNEWADLGAGLEGVNLVAAHIGVLGGEQAVQRPFDEVGVAGQSVTVGVRDLLGLDEQVDGVRGVGRHGREVVAGDDVEHFQQQETLGRRTGLVDHVLPIGGADWFADVGVMSREIGLGEQAAIR